MLLGPTGDDLRRELGRAVLLSAGNVSGLNKQWRLKTKLNKRLVKYISNEQPSLPSVLSTSPRATNANESENFIITKTTKVNHTHHHSGTKLFSSFRFSQTETVSDANNQYFDSGQAKERACVL